ncbi:7061_t:CDS:2 [Entrophospora sp. SA101]|nr:7061_t:CDS:2 [Entrophospora sp. SA101]
MLTKFNQAYSELIGKLPPSLENEAWKHLISRKRNPITEEDASTINPLIELFLNHEQYEEYYIPYNWIESKKSQLRSRFQQRLLEIEV